MMPLEELPTSASTWPEQAPISDGVEIDEDVRVGARCRKSSSAFDEREAAGVGVGIDEEELAGRLRERGKECIGLCVGVAQDGDRVPGGKQSWAARA